MTVTEATTVPSTGSPNIRRWIRQRQIAANGRVDPATVYSVILALGMAVALVGQPIIAVVWPAAPTPDEEPSALVLVGAGLLLLAFFGILRQLGPMAVSRSDATWLLTAPVSRRTLLGPALALSTMAAVLVGGVTGLAVVGHLAARPASLFWPLTGAIAGSAAALGLARAALHCQRRPASARHIDLLGGVVAGTLVGVAASAQLADNPYPLRLGSFPASGALVLACAALVVAGILWGTARAGLDVWPTSRIVDASANAGVYADAIYAVEPSFLTELSTRRYWQRRTNIRTLGLIRRPGLPPLVGQDLLIVRRKASRLWWLAGVAAAPTVTADGPRWLLITLVLVGAMAAAGFTSESTHRDAANPALVRLLGLPEQQVRGQRLVVPGLLAALWSGLALGGLQAAGLLSGPWWALGLAIGPAAAVAALQRARASAASIGNVLIETPLGAFPAGMLLWLVNGLDVLAVLTLPVSIGIATGTALEWHLVPIQLALSALGCVLLIRWTPTRSIKP
ncbi:hypothetical protein FXF50_08345 [Micromonospora sp. AP08]|uniref:DUF6297 family protein n=1 Tax=Micromonospora sp. AP08 TaxID=2604467 RepID=UPI0011D2EC7B|nr:DUF6297 family protein [Micromonospora sp. AP08]TYB39243.1 hypothetical protein FXF50_08345 [Micromonospora sp. AP08]